MAETITTPNLEINVLGHTEYDDILTPDKKQLYIVKEGNEDTDNSIASRTYADVGRELVYVGTNTPPSQYTKVWVDTDDETNFVHPADIDMSNLSDTGKENLINNIIPDYSSGIVISNTVGETYTALKDGWIFANAYEDSNLQIYRNNASGQKLIILKTDTNRASDNVLVKKDTVLFFNARQGTTEVYFYPCLGVSND